MSNAEKIGRIPLYIGQEPLLGSFYTAECTVCGWVGSSEVLTDDCQCTQDAGGRFCLGDTEEIGTDRLLEIVQAMARRDSESQQAHFRLIEHTNETEQYLDKAAEVLGEIVQSGQGQAYRECTDKSSPTGMHVAAVLEYAAQFQPEPHQPDEDACDENWIMNPCKKGHRDVGAAGGIAQCNQCGEEISAATTREAFEQWNISHPALPA